MTFKYSLDRSSHKFTCPACEKKRFVRYIDIETNNYLPDTYGRCDRETSCGYHKSPIKNENKQFKTLSSTSENYFIPDFIEYTLLKKSLKKYDENNFVLFLRQYFSNEEIQNCINKYKIGTSKNWKGATVFWQIDQEAKVHAGKIILFDKSNGKRIKNPYPHINWVHKKLKLDNFKLMQCLFGLHLIKNIPTTVVATFVATNVAIENCNENILLKYPIAIVESEKTAIIMSLFLPDYIWLATGSKQNLKLQQLLPLKKYQIILFPDKGEFSDWNKKTIEFQKLGFNIRCSFYVERSAFSIGTDLADIYLHYFKSSLIVYNKTEKTVHRLTKINPQIINLIKAFDLIDDKGNGIRIT